MKDEPLVSVIALCYNHQSFVIEALDSIRNQSYSNIQLIIIDDCSKDNSVDIIQKWRSIQKNPSQFIIHQINQGICKSLNEALQLVKGDFVAIIATDDLWLEEKLKSQVELFKNLGEDYGVVFSDAYRIDPSGKILPDMFIKHYSKLDLIPSENILPDLLERNFIPAPSVLIRSSCYHQVGFYDERLSFEDWDMWVRISRYYKFGFDSNILTKYRVVSTSLSHALFHSQNSQSNITYFLINKKWLEFSELTDTQKVHIKNALVRYAMNLNDLKDSDRQFYLKESLKYTFNLKVIIFFFLTFLAPQLEAKIYTCIKKLKSSLGYKN